MASGDYQQMRETATVFSHKPNKGLCDFRADRLDLSGTLAICGAPMLGEGFHLIP